MTGNEGSQSESIVGVGRVGETARRLDTERTVAERVRLPRRTIRRLVALAGVYLMVVLGLVFVLEPIGGTAIVVLPLVVLLAFAFELVDSAAGMGFGTALAPALFALGYDPLQVVPVLLFSELLTGLTAGVVHHEMDNATFSFRPINESTKLLALLAGVGGIAGVVSIVLVYAALPVPGTVIELYVALLVMGIGLIGLVRARLRVSAGSHPRRLVAFALLAGINKGIGGGGYGPVVTLGQVLSGVYEKSAVAVTTLAEGIVSLVGVVAFLLLRIYGVGVDLSLLPSVFVGGIGAALVSPYLVRVVPNAVWRYVIPIYAIAIGAGALVFGIGV
jgi:uncharacterized protein